MARSVETFPRCATCEHWIPDSPAIGGVASQGTCWLTESNGGPDQDTKAWAADASGYYAILNTKADFGCVQHQPHEG